MLKKLFWEAYIKSNPINYDETHKGTFSFLRKFFLILFRPTRHLIRFKYGQLFQNKKKSLSILKKKINDQHIKKKLLISKLSNFINDGYVVIEDYFENEDIDNFKKTYEKEINEIKNYSSENISYNWKDLALSKELNKLWLNDELMYFILAFFRRQVYARNYPAMNYTYVPNNFDLKKSKAASEWHVDHAVLFNLHILLEDVSQEESCMEVLPGTHKFFNHASLYSNPEISSLKKSLPKKCFGKKGTVYMHTGNVIHRLNPVKGSKRLNLHFEFSPGHNIRLDVNKIKECLCNDFNLDLLSSFKREILSGIFPRTLYKGYNYNNHKYYPNNFKGI